MWYSSPGTMRTSEITSMTDTAGNVYVFGNQIIDPGIGQQQVWFAKNIAASGPGNNTVTVMLNAAVPYPDLRAVEYSSIDTVHPLDVVVGSYGVSTLTTSGSATTTNANDTLIGSNYTNNATTGPGTGYTKRLIDTYSEIIEDENVASTGSYSATAPQEPTGEGSPWYIMQMLAVRAAGSTTGLPYPPSTILGSIIWNESSKQRYASGSDIWDSMPITTKPITPATTCLSRPRLRRMCA